MPRSAYKTQNVATFYRTLFVYLIAVLCIAAGQSTLRAQTPTPTPTPKPKTAATPVPAPTPDPRPDVMWGGYRVTSTTEIGYRSSSVRGNENKFRSDLNYKSGFRVFDTNLLLESDSGKGKYFDSLLISTSGWGADPSGFTRVNMEKTGVYKFNANVRRMIYYNNLLNIALNEHNRNMRHDLGDFDLTVLPQNEKLRFNFGVSYSNTFGTGGYTTRAYGDEFPVNSIIDNGSYDMRFGVEGKLFGFDYGLTEGYRRFSDRDSYSITVPTAGNNTTNTAALSTFSRLSPIDGYNYYTQFHLHRTFAKKFDFTARLIYSGTRTRSSVSEFQTGRDQNNNIVNNDLFQISGTAKRPQTRGDIGVTYMATSHLRISNTFTFDQFTVNGGDAFNEQLFRHNAAGNPLPTVTTITAGYRVSAYRRYTNTIEADYQLNNRIAFHAGYRYTHRNVIHQGFDATLTSPPSDTNPDIIDENVSNTTNTFLAGMKIKPLKNWVIFWDLEHGAADNVFTRAENYHFTDVRARSRWTFNKLSLNASVITKDKHNPSEPTDIQPLPFSTTVKNRFYSGTLDWSPLSGLTFNAGYTYNHLTSTSPILVPISGVYLLGFSQFFMRDRYANFDVWAKPFKRLSLFASYRISRDKGQGNRFSSIIQNIITSYPMQFVTPEFRVAIRLTRNVDWNVGYQYFDYKDSQTPTQNYRAHLPFTSLRIYFGNKSDDR